MGERDIVLSYLGNYHLGTHPHNITINLLQPKNSMMRNFRERKEEKEERKEKRGVGESQQNVWEICPEGVGQWGQLQHNYVVLYRYIPR
jgi:hypothetical protein